MDLLNTYYIKAENMSNVYDLNLVLGGSHVHKFKPAKIKDLVRFDVETICNRCHNDATGDPNLF